MGWVSFIVPLSKRFLIWDELGHDSHDSTGFEDFPELERKRHMLRVWLKMPDWVPWPDNMYWHEKGYRLSEGIGLHNENTQGERA